MRNFKGILVRACVLLLFVGVLNKTGEFLYKSVSDAAYFAEDDLEQMTGSIQTILLGTSIMQRGIHPGIVSEALDTVCFNMGSSAQPITGTYYLLKEQLKKNPVERVFMAVTVKSFMSDTDNRSTVAKIRVFDMLQSPLAKLEFMKEIAEPKEYEQFLFFLARVEEKLNKKQIYKNLSYRYTEDYEKQLVYPGTYLKYYGLGMIGNENEYHNEKEENRVIKASTWHNKRLCTENVDMIRKIAKLCKDAEVEFNLVVLPHSQEYASKQNLQDMDTYLDEFCEELEIGLFNYNYTSYEGIYEYVDNSCYMDRTHLNYYGAIRMADLLCQDYLLKKEQL